METEINTNCLLKLIKIRQSVFRSVHSINKIEIQYYKFEKNIDRRLERKITDQMGISQITSNLIIVHTFQKIKNMKTKKGGSLR